MNLKDLKLDDITRLVEDFQYALMRTHNMFGGAAAAKKKGKGEKFLLYLKIFFVVITLIIAVYFIYILLFRGYPRFILDLINLKFYNKINLDAFIQDKDFLLDNVKFLAAPNAYMPEVLYEQILKKSTYNFPAPKSIPIDMEYMKSKAIVDVLNKQLLNEYMKYSITTLTAALTQYIDTQYSDYKENAKYLEAFKEYYLFHDLVIDTSSDGKHAKSPDGIKFVKFYVKYWNYALAQGRETQQKGETNEEGQWRIFISDYTEKKVAVQKDRIKYGNHKRILHLVYLIKALANRCSDEQNKYIQKLQKHHFLVLPAADSQINNFGNNIIKLQTEKTLETIYNQKNADLVGQKDYIRSNTMDEFTWLMLEVMISARVTSQTNLIPLLKDTVGCTSASTNTVYDVWSCKLDEEINKIIKDVPNQDKSLVYMFMTAYMNASTDQKKTIKLKIRQGKGYLKNMHEGTFEIIDKLPIFSRIYFSNLNFDDAPKKNTNADTIKRNKQDLYLDVIDMYKKLMMVNPSQITKLGIKSVENQPAFYEMMLADYKTCLGNLAQNGNDMVQYMLATSMVNTYFNTYRVTLIREGMTKMYEDQYMNSEDFAKALWTPHMKEILEYRILAYFKKVFSKPYMGSTYKRFTLAWQKLGFFISSIEKMIKSAFTQKPKVKEPDQPASDS